MDTLVALGSTTAFAYSTWALFAGAPTHLYFMEAAGILTLISLGHWLEARGDCPRGDRAPQPDAPGTAQSPLAERRRVSRRKCPWPVWRWATASC